MNTEYRIAMLWVEGPLSFLERLCIKSFLDVGHHVTLYHYGDVSGVPEGTELADGNEVLRRDEFVTHTRTGSLALFSDVFRYHLLSKFDRTIWADTDAYCVKPFETPTGHFFGWESDHHINGGVLGLPQDSEALHQLLDLTKDEYGIPEWYEGKARRRLEVQKDAGEPVHVSDLPWGAWGPHAVTHFTQKTGESRYALAPEFLYPVPFPDRRCLVKAEKRNRSEGYLTPNTVSIHFYGRRIRDFLEKRNNGVPEQGSLLGHLLHKHGIDVDETSTSRVPASINFLANGNKSQSSIS